MLFSWHHLSHAASSFFCSPFEEAAILTADGVGEWATTTTGWGKNNKIYINKEIFFPHSIGLLYSTFTSFCGFEINHGEYKFMGLASYGSPRYVDEVWKLVKVNRDGSFQLDMDYFSFQHSTTTMFSRKFTNLFGQPRNVMYQSNVDQVYADLASSVQFVLEQILFGIATKLHEETGMTNLCLAGGVALNSVANGKMIRNTPFDEIYIQPASGDGGGALGAALTFMIDSKLTNRNFIMDHAFWGPEFTDEEIKKTLTKSDFEYTYYENKEDIQNIIIKDILENKVIGLFQNKMEWGPRALGNRSIIANPTIEEMKDIVNSKIKFREPYRPFAPSVMEDKIEDIFITKYEKNVSPNDFMLNVIKVKSEYINKIPAVSHMGTARIQSVRKQNKDYYNLIKKFYDITGIPLLLNTSFNIKGEPIVCSPADALNTFSKSGLDKLALGNYYLTK